MNKDSNMMVLLKGLIRENPVFVLVLGTCPTLATTSTIIGAISMGLAATAVLMCSNAAVSLLRKLIPDTVRIPCYIVIIAARGAAFSKNVASTDVEKQLAATLSKLEVLEK